MGEAGDLDDRADVARGVACGQEAAGLHHHADPVADAAADAGDFDAVGEAVVGEVVFGEGVDLGFAAEAAERAGEDDAVVVDVEVGAQGVRAFLGGRGYGGDDFAVFGAEALGAEQLRPVHAGGHGGAFGAGLVREEPSPPALLRSINAGITFLKNGQRGFSCAKAALSDGLSVFSAFEAV